MIWVCDWQHNADAGTTAGVRGNGESAVNSSKEFFTNRQAVPSLFRGRYPVSKDTMTVIGNDNFYALRLIVPRETISLRRLHSSETDDNRLCPSGCRRDGV